MVSKRRRNNVEEEQDSCREITRGGTLLKNKNGVKEE